MRTLLILAVLLFIGFFVWRALFKNTKIFEGQQGQQQNVLNAVTEIVNTCRTSTNNENGPFQWCVTTSVNNDLAQNFTLADANDAVTLKATDKSTSIIGNITSTVMTRMGQPQPQRQFNVDRTDPGGSALSECNTPNQNNLLGCFATALNIGQADVSDAVKECTQDDPTQCIRNGLSRIWYQRNP